MKNVNVTLRIDDETKKQADAILAEMGMSLTTAVNIFLKQVIWDRQIPFTISRQTPNPTTLAAMDAAESVTDVYGPFDSVDALMEALNA